MYYCMTDFNGSLSYSDQVTEMLGVPRCGTMEYLKETDNTMGYWMEIKYKSLKQLC